MWQTHDSFDWPLTRYLCGHSPIARIKQFDMYVLDERSARTAPQSVKENECEFPLNALTSSVNGRTHKNQVNLIKPYAVSSMRLYDYYRCLRRLLQVICFRYFFAWQTKWLACASNTLKPVSRYACKRTPTQNVDEKNEILLCQQTASSPTLIILFRFISLWIVFRACALVFRFIVVEQKHVLICKKKSRDWYRS